MNQLQLRYFVTVAQLENISRAAEVYHISQSSISKNIAKLEAELGLKLFTRNGKNISLNPAGARFLESSISILREIDRAISAIHTLTNAEDVTIKVGFAGRIKDLFVCIQRFKASHPDIQFDLKSDIENMDHIDINDFDVLIYPDDARYARFTGYAVGEEKYLFAVSADSALAKSAVASPSLMQGLDFVFLRRGEHALEFPYQICNSLAIDMRSQNFADSRGAHRRMISMNMAVGFVPEGEAPAYRLDKKIHLLPILDPRFSRQMKLCFKREKHLSEAALDFKDCLIRDLNLSTHTPR